MWLNQIFSLIASDYIQNIIVCDNYEIANQIARATYGSRAFAVDTTHYPVGIGNSYKDGKFYDIDGNEVLKNKTEWDKIKEMELSKAEAEVEIELRLSIMELGLNE